MFRKYGILIGLLPVSLALTGFSSPLQAAGQSSSIPWWVIVLVVVLGLLLGLWLLRRPGEEVAPTGTEAVTMAHVAEMPAPGDLTRMEGIGPKISSLLQTAGITTFAQLAAADVSRLEQILTEADLLGLADPTTWPEQARLAAAGEWDALEALQDELKGGRRV